MNDTGIIWTQATWNPMSGCEKITAGCAFCYAYSLAEQKRGSPAFPNGFDLTIRPHKLREPFNLKAPTLIFVNSMSDMFWEAIEDDYRDKMIDVMEATPQHEYQVLTKRPENMLRYSKRRKLPPNFWAGTTIEGDKVAGRAKVLKQVKAEIHFVSAEPLIERLTKVDWNGIDWCITGGESGNHLGDPKLRALRGLCDPPTAETRDPLRPGQWVPRPSRIPWVRAIRDDCFEAGTKFFHKQWGGPTAHSGGRVLDGRVWDEFPRLPVGAANGGLNHRLNTEAAKMASQKELAL
jgi:protein gp37